MFHFWGLLSDSAAENKIQRRRRPLRLALGAGVLVPALQEGAGITVRQGLAAGLAQARDQRPLPVAPPLRVEEPRPIMALEDADRHPPRARLVVHPPLGNRGGREYFLPPSQMKGDRRAIVE